MSYATDRAEMEAELENWAKDRNVAYLEISVLGCAACMALDGVTYGVKRAMKDMPLPNSSCTRKRCECVFVGVMRDEAGATTRKLDHP